MYRRPVKRVFRGLAGSPLSRVIKQAAQQSDFTVRKPRTSDRAKPVVLDPLTKWIDQYGQKHGAIDEDCAFQTCAFDPDLRGVAPVGTNHVPQKTGTDRGPWSATDPAVPTHKRRREYGVGIIQGDRSIKMRRATRKTSWIFDSSSFTAYLLDVKERKGADVATMVAKVLYDYYYCNREDLDIWYKFHRQYWDTANIPSVQEMMDQTASKAVETKGAKEVKSFRQYHQRRGWKFTNPMWAASPAAQAARRVLVVRYTYEGYGHHGVFVEGRIASTDAMLGAFIGELSELRRTQGFTIEVQLQHTLDRVFPNYKQALQFVRSIGLKPTADDQLLGIIPKAKAS